MTNSKATRAPVTSRTLQECEVSARFWAGALPGYAAKMRKTAATYSIIATALTLITGLGAWKTLAASTELWAIVMVSALSVALVLAIQIPQLIGYAQCAGASSVLAKRYGHSLGDLIDAMDLLKTGAPGADEVAEKVRRDFEAIREDKEDLQPYPADLQAQRR
jgi:hypothetical protein